MKRLLHTVVLGGIASLGCGSPAPTPREPDVSNKSHGLALAQRADRALAEATRPDYRRPILGVPFDLAAIGQLYVAACRAGDHQSCWKAAPFDDPKEAAAQVIENCRAGELLSCRAIPMHGKVDVPNDLPGRAGRAQECDFGRCSLTKMQEECDAGFPFSCDQIVRTREPPIETRPYDYHVSPALVATVVRLARQGCTAGILAECSLLASRSPLGANDDRLYAYERACALAAYDCQDLGELYEEKGDLTKAQALYERECQFGAHRCFHAALGYLEKHVPEPVPHRGHDLAKWVCQRGQGCSWGTQSDAPPAPP